MEIYFDNAATTRISDRALEEYIRVSKDFSGNPSSGHRLGQKAKTLLEEKREKIASLIGAGEKNMIFTSGATESISLFFQSLLWMGKGTVIMSRIEHEAVSSWEGFLKNSGWNVIRIKARGGFVSPDELEKTLTPDTKAVAIMSVNNVTGAIEPVRELVGAVRRYEKQHGRRILFFCDSVQALGKTPLLLREWDIDAASFSAHKINGPRGIGLLYAKNAEIIRPLAVAGGQERGRRGGTENLPAIAAFETALSEWMERKEEAAENACRIKLYLRENLERLEMKIFSPENSSPYILSAGAPLPSEVFTRMLMDRGFCVSAGSACSSNSKGKTDRILEAMGINAHDAAGAIRISLSRTSTLTEAEELVKAIKEIMNV